ncbi:hypothetical protein [Altericroceibacterium xinjiangense]|nr:hypothetical protein [Altericroceibacterium xinjiangense]
MSLVATLGEYALGKGWTEQDLLELLTGLVAIVIPSTYGIYKS